MTNKDDETELFQESQKKTRPLKPSGKIQHPKKKRGPQRMQQPEFDDAAEKLCIDRDISVSDVTGEQSINFSQSGVQPKTLKQLKQGKIPVEAELDLHGYILIEAENAIKHFVQDALEKNYRCLRIIHGKGFSSQQEFPALKNLVNRYLSRDPHVLAFHSAPKQWGGVGAVVILLARPKSEV